MTQSQSRFSIVERLTQTKLDIMKEKSDMNKKLRTIKENINISMPIAELENWKLWNATLHNSKLTCPVNLIKLQNDISSALRNETRESDKSLTAIDIREILHKKGLDFNSDLRIFIHHQFNEKWIMHW